MTIIHKQIMFCICLLMAVHVQATVIRVPADQTTIQAAINSASKGDTIVVYPGTYFENIVFRGKNIVVTSRFYETGDLNFVRSTIIDGSQPVQADTASCVLIVNHEDSTAILQGFTITGGQGTKWTDEHGAGIYREGGGILVAFSAPTIRYNLIMNNEATNITGVNSSGGGGIRAGDGNPRILNNVVSSNKGRYGAGIVLNYTGAILRNNILTNNSGGQDYGGGALWMNHDGSSEKIIENNTIAGNKTIAVYVWQGASTIRNCIIWADSTVSAVQIGVRTGGPTVTYSNVLGGWAGAGNIFTNPLFADSSFHLKSSSPCVDSGDSASIDNDIENPLSQGHAQLPSRGGLRNDMGAYGGSGASELPNLGTSTGVSSSKVLHPTGFRLEQNFPNPFNPSTMISFSIPKKSFVSLIIVDVLGRKIATLVSKELSMGTYSCQWNASNIASGIYFYRISAVPSVRRDLIPRGTQDGQAGSFIDTKKLVLMR